MNKSNLFFWLTALILGCASCVKEKELHPILIPSLVNGPITKVEAFDEHNSLFVGTENGVLIRLSDKSQYIFEPTKYSKLEEVDWSVTEVLYSPIDEHFWLISNALILQFGPDFYEEYMDETPFYEPTGFYVDYSVSPSGDLYRTGYYKEFWDPNSGSFFSDYYIGIYRFLGNPNNGWQAFETDMTISSENLVTPNAVFNQTGKMVLTTNPQYNISGLPDTVDFIAQEKTAEGFNYKGVQDPFLIDDRYVLGLNVHPRPFVPATELFSTTINEKPVSQLRISENCEYNNEAIGPVKLLDHSNTSCRFYIQFFSNELTKQTEDLGFIAELALDGSYCNISAIKTSEQIMFSETISDLDALGSTIYIGTENGLFLYDLQTGALTTYFDELFDDRLE
ncbi:MAG: hypothetical protein WEC59_00510 [Salibacteraceae bacterium]